jgi:hypothetical protein
MQSGALRGNVGERNVAPNLEPCMSKREQLTVPIDAQLRDFLERQAAREDRTLAAMV